VNNDFRDPSCAQIFYKNVQALNYRIQMLMTLEDQYHIVLLSAPVLIISFTHFVSYLIYNSFLCYLAPASYAQARIWLDEQVRFDPNNPQVAIYNMPFLYRLSSGTTLSINQLRRALHLVVIKHQSLRTSLLFDSKENMLMQRVNDPTHNNSNNELFTWIETTFQTEDELNSIMHDERGNPNHFILSRGLVFRCHILHHGQTSSGDILGENDTLIFNFHHALFDFPSMEVFHRDLNQAYMTGELITDEKTDLRYLDCEFSVSCSMILSDYMFLYIAM
jgi:hypothetical protein